MGRMMWRSVRRGAFIGGCIRLRGSRRCRLAFKIADVVWTHRCGQPIGKKVWP